MSIVAGHRWLVRLNSCGRVRCEPGWQRGPDWSARLRDYDLWFVWAGHGRVLMTDADAILEPGVCLWMRPGRRYEATQESASRLGISFFHFDLLDPRNGRPLHGFAPPFEIIRTHELSFLDAALRRVIDLQREPVGATAARELFGAVLSQLLHEQAMADQAQTGGIDQHHLEVVQRIASGIRESPGDTGPVTELARAAGYSVDHFSRIFAKVTGFRPRDYVIAAKMERARQLLAESTLTIGMIAAALGYRSVFFFSRQFRQQTGHPPTDYRRRMVTSRRARTDSPRAP